MVASIARIRRALESWLCMRFHLHQNHTLGSIRVPTYHFIIGSGFSGLFQNSLRVMRIRLL